MGAILQHFSDLTNLHYCYFPQDSLSWYWRTSFYDITASPRTNCIAGNPSHGTQLIGNEVADEIPIPSEFSASWSIKVSGERFVGNCEAHPATSPLATQPGQPPTYDSFPPAGIYRRCVRYGRM